MCDSSSRMHNFNWNIYLYRDEYKFSVYTVGIIETVFQEKEFDMDRVSHTCINLNPLLYRHAFLLLCICFSDRYTSQVLDYSDHLVILILVPRTSEEPQE